VRLPLEAATDWDDGLLAFDNSTAEAAFGRELTPVAAPSRPLSADTPVSGGGRFAGAVVYRDTRLAAAILIERAGRLYSVPAEGVSFEGKTLHPGVQPEAILPYYTEEEARDRVRAALAATREVSSAELAHITVHSDGGAVRLDGNVRSRQARTAARQAASAALGLPVDASGLAGDMEIETRVALALDRARLDRALRVNVRSVMGEVVLRGQAPSRPVADEAARVAAHLPGVRKVTNLIEAETAGAPPTGLAAR
jgi:osmotically-inducible protein OsmY